MPQRKALALLVAAKALSAARCSGFALFALHNEIRAHELPPIVYFAVIIRNSDIGSRERRRGFMAS